LHSIIYLKLFKPAANGFSSIMKIKHILLSVVILICFIACVPAYAQTGNMSSVNVDDLSDGQVQKIMQQQATAGLTDDQLIKQLELNGLPAEQGDRLKTRIEEMRGGDAGNSNAINSADSAKNGELPSARKLNYKPDTGKQIIDVQSILSPKIFGADLFRNSNNHTFEPNLKLATPQNYVLGPEDQVDINVYGNSVVNWNLDVTPDGNINIPGAGILNVSGKTIEQATALIKNKLIANNYQIGHGATLQVSLGNIRSIKVILVGDVVRPGTYTLPSVSTAFNALYAAGGPDDNGSFRQIEIVRNNKVIRRLDVYDFLLKGDESNNIVLQDQDIIRVPAYKTRVQMTGEVKTPAYFEVLPGESLLDVLNFAGGFTDAAYTALIKVVQVNDQQLRITDVAEKDYGTYKPMRGDKFIVQHIINRYENRVTINGAVFRPGDYELKPGMTLSQLIADAAGLKEDAFMQRGSIIRLKPDNTTELIPFSPADVMSKTADITLQREDRVKIVSIFDLRDKYTVTIKGQVRKPGEFSYADSMTVEDLIIKAGGFSTGASTKRIEVASRVSNSDPSSKSSELSQVFSVDVNADFKEKGMNFTLQPFDVVSVYSLPGYEKQSTVRVEGEVLYPGYYTIQRKNERISDIISRAGGPTASADVSGGNLERDNTLGVDRQKIDSLELLQLQQDSINRTKYHDTTLLRPHNNYVGINLKKILQHPGEDDDLILQNGDVITVPKEQQIVRVNGEVLYPSEVVYDGNRSLKEYVLKAGGFSADADISHAYVVYSNGSVKGSKKFLFFFRSHPSVEPGAEINVPKKPYKRPMSAQEILGITSSIASLALIIVYVINNSK
jgi:protein involved in polysaccharide export with SLBB domain